MNTGSGGIGAVSVGILGDVVAVVVLAIAVFAGWKIVKLIWAAFSG